MILDAPAQPHFISTYRRFYLCTLATVPHRLLRVSRTACWMILREHRCVCRTLPASARLLSSQCDLRAAQGSSLGLPKSRSRTCHPARFNPLTLNPPSVNPVRTPDHVPVRCLPPQSSQTNLVKIHGPPGSRQRLRSPIPCLGLETAQLLQRRIVFLAARSTRAVLVGRVLTPLLTTRAIRGNWEPRIGTAALHPVWASSPRRSHRHRCPCSRR